MEILVGNMIRFDVCFSWPGANVDVVLAQYSSFAWEEKANAKTPKIDSVDQFLKRIGEDMQIKSLGFEEVSACGLMMGCARIEYECESQAYNRVNLGRLVERIGELAAGTVKYYREGKVVGHSINMVGA